MNSNIFLNLEQNNLLLFLDPSNKEEYIHVTRWSYVQIKINYLTNHSLDTILLWGAINKCRSVPNITIVTSAQSYIQPQKLCKLLTDGCPVTGDIFMSLITWYFYKLHFQLSFITTFQQKCPLSFSTYTSSYYSSLLVMLLEWCRYSYNIYFSKR